MIHAPLRLFWALFAAVLLAACSSSSGNNREPVRHGAEEEGEDEPALIALAKSTNTSYLTNVREIGLTTTAGRVTCMVIDRTDSNHLIAGSATGGLWVSRNRGRTWAPIDDQLPTLNIRSLTQHPTQAAVYYASCNAALQVSASPLTFRPDIYKSTDGGQTFQLLPATSGGFSQVVKVACSPVSATTVYALADNFGISGLFRSTDNGQTFSSVFSLGTSAADLVLLPDGSVIVSGSGKVFRSPNGNSGTFTLVKDGTTGPNTFTNMGLAFCAGQPAQVYGLATGGNTGVGVFRSTDGGQSWSFLQTLTTGIITRTIGVKPNNPAFFFGGSVGLYLSQNSGGSFVFYGVGGVDWWSVNFDPHNPDKVFMTFDGGIVEVGLNPFNPNNNTAYQTRDSLLNCAQLYAGDYFPVGDKVIGGLQDLGTNLIFPGGDRGVASGDGGYCFFNKQDTTVAYGSYQNGDIFKKTSLHIAFPQPGFTQPVSIRNQLDANNDGTIDEGAFFINPFWMNNADGQQLYYPTKQRLWRSVNGGTSWQPVSPVYSLTSPTGSGEIFMDGNQKANPVVYWSALDTLYVKPNAATAGAGNELKIKMPDKIRWVRVDPANDSIVYITSYTKSTGARIYRSGNLFKGNVQWTSLTGDLPDGLYVRCVEVNPLNKNVLVAGTSSGLYVSADGGQHWDREGQLPNVSILRTSVRPSDRRLFIYTYGRGAWAASFPQSGSGVGAQGTIAGNLTVWPNPTSGIVHLNVPEAALNSDLRVWSADGRLVKTVAGIRNSAVAVDLGDLPPGGYVLALLKGNRRLAAARVIRY